MIVETAETTENSLLEPLRQTWSDVCCRYDFVAAMPEVSSLFVHVPLSRPFQAAEQVLVNMLVEATECVDRFSPWYTKPASAYGLAAARSETAHGVEWRLSEEGCRRWWAHIERLAAAIDKNASLLEATILVDSLMVKKRGSSLVKAHCRCQPPRYIHVRRHVVNNADAVCDLCDQPFVLAQK